MGYDPRWHDIAADWLDDAEINPKAIETQTPKLAQQLQDTAEQFLTDLARDEHAEREAARDEADGK